YVLISRKYYQIIKCVIFSQKLTTKLAILSLNIYYYILYIILIILTVIYINNDK
ncbi:MAG: hypothetical protein Faunusvirus66_5, partial [Faunusvirus sp.]